MSKYTKVAFRLIDLVVIFVMTFGSPMSAMAAVWTDQADYAPGSTVTINGDNSDGAGYLPGEIVHVDVTGPNGYTAACEGMANDAGAWSCQVTLAADESAVGDYFYLATGQTSGVSQGGSFTDAPIFIVDDNGADDFPGQKDLNFLSVDYAFGPSSIQVKWGWDDTAWSGNNTGDACTLFDTDSDGKANYSLCVTVEGIPAVFKSVRLYTCGDSSSDRCAQPNTLVSPITSTATAAVLENADPFGTSGSAYYTLTHVTGNACGDAPGCYTRDTVANVIVQLSDVGGGIARLINVCSYPSEIPNSAPSECVITPNNGLLTIVKVANPNDGTPFVFNLGAGQTSQNGTSSWTINGSGKAQLISFAPGTAYDLSEAIPASWMLDSVSCAVQTNPVTPSGTPDTLPVSGPASGGITDFTIQSGLETICTFTDTKTGSIIVEKQTSPDGAAGNFTFTGDAAGTISDNGQIVVNNLAPGTYTSTEADPSPAFALSSITCNDANSVGDAATRTATFHLEAGETVKCTFTNTQQPAMLTLVKTVVNDNGGTAVANDFQGYIDGNPVAWGTAQSVAIGSHTASEATLPGYTASTWGGDCATDGSITLKAGDNKTCSITNDDVAPTLTLVKTVKNDNGGTKTVADFPLFINGTQVTSGVANSLTANVLYTASETNLSGYTASTWGGDCAADGTITLQPGDNKTCTITNDDQGATITVVKVVTNDDGGTALPDDFALTLEGNPVLSGVAVPVDPGTYTAGETQLSGYTFEGFSGDCDSNGDVTVALGETKTCTLTNNDQQATITVVKVVTNDNGGTAAPDDFKLTLEGNPVLSGVAVPVDPGTYTAAETLLPGYTFEGFSGDCGLNGDVTVALGEHKTCTLTNNDVAPKLIVIKHVINDNGGTSVAADFTLDSGGINDTPDNFAGEEAPGTTVTLDAGSYNVTETGPSGYSASFSADCSGTITVGETKTCTVTNDDITAHLTLVKVVVNDNGGNAVATDFTLSASGPTSISGAGGADGDVDAGTYDLSETTLPGYTAGSWSCVSNDEMSDGSSITLALGQSATCTIINDDIAPTLTLIKIVVNDDGGNAVVSDFPLFINGNAVTSGVAKTLSANTLYTATETNLAGYTPSVWGGDCAADGTITLNEGDNKTCTITNDDVAPTLKLVKVVKNDDGGNAVADDWTLSADAGVPFDGRNFSNTGGSGLFETVFANTGYDLSESGFAGYTAGSWSCDGGTLVGSTVTLDEGKNVTCTITNDDVAPTLTLIKIVVNDDGGNAVVSDFPLFISGTPAVSGMTYTLDANVLYTASETTQPGYTPLAWGGDCAADGTITLNEGDNKTCTITNDDVAPTLKLVKKVVNDNGGNAVGDDWVLYAVASIPNNLRNFSNYGGSGAFETVFANIGYDLSESSFAGYTAGSWSCDGGTLAGSTVTLAEGETNVTCTITNDDIAPILHLRKLVVNDNGGTKTAADFTLTANGAGTNDLSGISPVDSGAGFKADTWALSETSVFGYSASAWSCDGGTQNGSNITLAVGEEATCTITNDDQPGTIIVIKNAKPASGNFAFTTTGTGYVDFSLTGDTANNGNKNTQILNAGSYSLKESTQLGWILTGIGGSSDPNTPYSCIVTGSGGSTGVGDLNTQTATIDLKNGDTVTCVFENTGMGVTRTQGFWATHPQLAQIAWFGGTAFGHTFPGVTSVSGIGDNLICGRPVDSLEKLMGAFWSDISKKSTGAKRTSLDQARMQLLQQLMAAELNASAFGTVPSGGSAMFAKWETALCGTNITAIKRAVQQAASFNTAGDSGIFTPGTSADSKFARSIADYKFWDIIKP